MQGSGNYPNFYFSGDLKGVVGGCIWPQTSEDKMLNGGHSSKAFLSPLSAGLYFECGRDALKQIMLMQEATFRDQVYPRLQFIFWLRIIMELCTISTISQSYHIFAIVMYY